MDQNNKKLTALYSCLPYTIFFITLFIYFAFFIDYVLFYQEKSSLFVFTSGFLTENLHQPGGPLVYLGKFFTTFFYNPVSGSLVISSVITLIVLAISKIVTYLSGKSLKVLPFLIGAALFFMQTDYRFSLVNNLGLLLQLAFFYISVKYLASFLKGWIPVVLIPLWYFVSGGFTLLFIIMLTFYFLFSERKKSWIRIILIWSLSLATFYISKEFLFFQPGKVLFQFPYEETNTGEQSILFLAVACLLSLLPALSGIKIELAEKIKTSTKVKDISGNLILFLVLIAIAYNRFDIRNKHYFHVEKLFYENNFDEVIRYNTLNPPTNLLTIFLNNIALCERDRLDDMLFNYPQSPDGQTLFLKWEMVGEILRRGGYFYYTIGMPNEAHRWAFENMVMKGNTPEGIKMLIKTDLINGNYDVASKYINILKRTLFYNREARSFERLLSGDEAIDADPELGEKRQNRLETDFFSITDDPYVNIERILSVDSLNKKAYEYKLAFMLIRKDYKGIENELPRIRYFGFTKLPTHIEEAAITLSALNNGKMPDTGNMRINSNSLTRWDEYLRILSLYGNDPKRAEPALKRQFGNTFWYWAVYR